ncbi:MAG: hypothetical protein F6K56_42515 [Moorea sp. SIO3G5]|nr:hypothetical protein [Moorena sp. SIO3G5]
MGESLFFVSRDGGKEKEFIKQWGMIGRYFEMRGGLLSIAGKRSMGYAH